MALPYAVVLLVAQIPVSELTVSYIFYFDAETHLTVSNLLRSSSCRAPLAGLLLS